MIAKKTTPAAGYIRMSTDKQDKSPAQQREAIERLAKDRGYHVVAWYEDHGISGDATERRGGFLKMRDDAESGDFEIVLAWDSSRIGRFDSLEGGYWLYPFIQAGIAFETVVDGSIGLDSFAGRLVHSITAESNHKYLRDLSQATLRGKIAKLKKGLWIAPIPPFGYVKGADGHLAEDSETSPTVKRIFKLYAEGASLQKITHTLNAEGLPSRTGGLWNGQTVRNILSSEAYLGTVASGARTTAKYSRLSADGPERVTRRLKHAEQGEPQIRVKNAHPALIDRKTFNDCQQRFSMNKKRTTPVIDPENPVLLGGGLVKCGCCGATMIGTTINNRRIYTCQNYKSRGTHGCQRRTVPEADLARFVVAKIQHQFASPAAMAVLEKHLRTEAAAMTHKAPREDEKDALTRRLKALDKKIDKAAERLLAVPDDLLDVASEKLRAYRREREGVRIRLEGIEETRDPQEIDVEALIERSKAELARLADTYRNGDQPALQAAFREYVGHIDLWVDRVPMVPGGTRCRCEVNRGILWVRVKPNSALLVKSVQTVGAVASTMFQNPSVPATW